jgi:ribosome modulation factor
MTGKLSEEIVPMLREQGVPLSEVAADEIERLRKELRVAFSCGYSAGCAGTDREESLYEYLNTPTDLYQRTGASDVD